MPHERVSPMAQGTDPTSGVRMGQTFRKHADVIATCVMSVFREVTPELILMESLKEKCRMKCRTRKLSGVHVVATVMTILTLVCGMTVSQATASVGDVAEWNVGSGQFNGNFVREYYSVSNQQSELLFQIERGLRASERFQGPNYTPQFDTDLSRYYYEVPAGVSTGTAAVWNFDLSVNMFVADSDHAYSGFTIDSFTALTLEISGPGLTTATVDLLDPDVRAAIDAHTPPTAMGDDPADPDHFYQASQNLAWWFPSEFDADTLGTYTFTLSGQHNHPTFGFGVDTTTSIDVRVTPEPASLALLGLGGLLMLRRRGRSQ